MTDSKWTTSRLALLLVAAVSLAACATAAPPASDQLPASIKFIPGYFGEAQAPDGNTVILEGQDGLIVIDTGRHLDHQDKILAYARDRRTSIVALINSHWHLDHSGGNAEIRAVFPHAHLYASNAIAGALDGFLARSLERGLARLADPVIGEAQKAETRLGVAAIRDRANLLPDRPVTGDMPLRIAGRTLRLHLARYAATEGDVWVHDPASGTVIAGDLVVVPAPFFDTACPEGWRRALADIARVKFATLIPGHGNPMSRADFLAYRKAFDALVDCSKGDAAKQICIDGWLNGAARFLPSAQDRQDVQELLDDYFDNRLRAPPEQRDLYCAKPRPGA